MALQHSYSSSFFIVTDYCTATLVIWLAHSSAVSLHVRDIEPLAGPVRISSIDDT